jgi:hypothetical protein
VVEPSDWDCWKGILIENLKKIKKQEERQQQHYLFYLGSLRMKLHKKNIFNIFQI